MINLLIISALNVKEKEEEEQMGRRKRWKTSMKEKWVMKKTKRGCVNYAAYISVELFRVN